MLWFLRLFPAFRALESSRDETVSSLRETQRSLRETVQTLQQQNLSLQDRLDATIEDRRQMWELLTKSIEEMKIAYQMHVNQQWAKTVGTTPYPDAPHPPIRHAQMEEVPAIGRQRKMPSEMVQEATEQFLTQMFSR